MLQVILLQINLDLFSPGNLAIDFIFTVGSAVLTYEEFILTWSHTEDGVNFSVLVWQWIVLKKHLQGTKLHIVVFIINTLGLSALVVLFPLHHQ